MLRLKLTPGLVVALMVAAVAIVPGPSSQAALGRTVFEDTFEGLSEAPGNPPNNWNIFVLPPFNDTHQTRWQIENNTSGSPTYIDQGGSKSLSWDDVPVKAGDPPTSDHPTDPSDDENVQRDDFPAGVVYRNPSSSSDRPGNLRTYTMKADVRLQEIPFSRLSQNQSPLKIDEPPEGDSPDDYLVTYAAAVGVTLLPAGNAQPCPEGFGTPDQECRPAAGLAAGIVITDPGTTLEEDTTDDLVEVGAIYFSGWINQNDVTQSDFDEIVVPVRSSAAFGRDQLFGSKHTVTMYVSNNTHVGLDVDGVNYGWGELKNPDGSALLVPPSQFTGYAMAGLVRNHNHFDNVKVNAGLPTGLPATTPTPAPTATPDPTPTPTPTPVPTPTPTPDPNATPTPTPTPSPTPDPNATPTPTPSPTPTPGPTATPTPTPAPTPPPGGAEVNVRGGDDEPHLGADDTNGGESIGVGVTADLDPGQTASIAAAVTDSGGATRRAGPFAVSSSEPSKEFQVPIDGLAEGPVNLQITGSRSDGNEIFVSRALTLDLTAPATTISTPDGAMFYSIPFLPFPGSNVRIEGAAADAGGVRVVQVMFENTDFGGRSGPFFAQRSGPADAPTWVVSGVRLSSPGTWRVTAYALDEALNEGPSAEIDILVL